MKHGETIKTWQLALDGKEHSFRFEHQFWTGEKKCYIDEQLIEHIEGGLMQSASFAHDVPFNIDTHEGKFRYRAFRRAYSYDLIIDGKEIEGAEDRALRLPVWAMVFIALIIIISGISLGQVL